MTNKGLCPNCNMPIQIRNPSGKCDHLYYPELVPKVKRSTVERLSNPQSIEDVLMQCGAYGSGDSKYIAHAIIEWIRSKGEGIYKPIPLDNKDYYEGYNEAIDDLIREIEK